MVLTPSLIFLFFSIVKGQYDTLERRAGESVPPRVQQLRDYLVDRGMFQEAVFHLLSYAVPTDSANQLCSNHSSVYQLAVLADQPWALRMVDASSKLGDGVLQGNIQGLGSYDECLEVREPNQLFSGQLCLVQTKGVLPPVVHNPETAEYSLLRDLPLDLTLAVCLPSTCSPQDVAAHWREVADELNATAIVESFDCSVKGDVKPGKHFWQAVCVLVTLFALLLASSWYDWAVNHQPAKNRRVLVCFSIFTSWRKLTGRDRRTDSLDILDGLRILAISWIVLGHRFEQSLQVPNLTLLDMERIYEEVPQSDKISVIKKWFSFMRNFMLTWALFSQYTTAWFMSPILNMMMGVELFFLISGCLLSFHFLRSRARGERFNLMHFYYKRYTRLTPALALVMVLEGCILFYVSDGPLWKRLIGNRVSSCVDNWWTNLLYISNYVYPYNTCLLQSWYLSADMQLYLISPLLLIPLSLQRTADSKSAVCSINRGLVLLSVCYFATTAAAFVNAFYYRLPAGATVTLDKKTERNHGSEYVVTHVRAASWLTGIALGYVLHRVKKGELYVNFNKVTLSLSWTASLCLCVAAVYSIAPFQSPRHHYNRVVDSLHIALHRNIFSLGAAGVIFLCVIGKGGPVQAFLGWRVLRPLAILSYGVYLSHMGLQALGLARIRQPLSFDVLTLWTGFFSDLVMANLAAAVIFFLVESPFWELGQWLYKPGKEENANKSGLHDDFINTAQEKTAL